MPGRILLVEDDESIRSQSAVLLEDEGYDVHQAAGGRETITRFERRPADCGLLDMMLPDGNAFDTCRAIRSRSISHRHGHRPHRCLRRRSRVGESTLSSASAYLANVEALEVIVPAAELRPGPLVVGLA